MKLYSCLVITLRVATVEWRLYLGWNTVRKIVVKYFPIVKNTKPFQYALTRWYTTAVAPNFHYKSIFMLKNLPVSLFNSWTSCPLVYWLLNRKGCMSMTTHTCNFQIKLRFTTYFEKFRALKKKFSSFLIFISCDSLLHEVVTS